MQDFPKIGQPSTLLIKRLLDRVLVWAPQQKIIYRDLRELTYTEFYQRVQRLANLLQTLGIRHGDRIGVMDYDSHRYLEFFFAVPMVGAVLHTINVRLSPDQILYTINHADDKLLFVNDDFLPLAERLAPHWTSAIPTVRLTDTRAPSPR